MWIVASWDLLMMFLESLSCHTSISIASAEFSNPSYPDKEVTSINLNIYCHSVMILVFMSFYYAVICQLCHISYRVSKKKVTFHKTVMALEGEPFGLRGCPSHSL